MTLMRLAALSAALMGPLMTLAYTHEFIASSGDWSDANNWDTGTVPGSTHEVWIPSGRTCNVANADQAVKTLDVDGTLDIRAKTLTIGQTSTTTNSTVDGNTYLTDVGGTRGVLKCKGNVSFGGSGTITCDGGVLDRVDNSSSTKFTLASGFTLKGHVNIIANIANNGLALVDTSGDIMELGGDGGVIPVPQASGTGKFKVTAGLIKVRTMSFASTTPEWEMTGGEINIADVQAPQVGNLSVKFVATGGTFYFSENFKTTAFCSFTGATITANPSNNVKAEFVTP